MIASSLTKSLKIHHDDGPFPIVTDGDMMLRLRQTIKQQRRLSTDQSFEATKCTPNLSGRSVKFGNVCLREYERTMGDGPCSSGPPIGIGWKYRAPPLASTSASHLGTDRTEAVIPLDEYERISCPRLKKELLLSRFAREDILIGGGFSRKDIAEAVRDNIKLKNQRRQTITNLNMAPYEEILERWGRSLRKLLMVSSEKTQKARSRNLYDKCADDSGVSGSNISVESTDSVPPAPRKGILKKTDSINAQAKNI